MSTSNNILIIDDEKSIREIIQDILIDEGYKVFTAGDGLGGMEIVQTEPIDLIFLDIWLPGIGGIELLKRIREEFPLIEVVMISGHANIEMAVNAIKLGAYDMLEKPLSLSRIITLCKRILELGNLKRENQFLKAQLGTEQRMLGKSKSIHDVMSIIHQTAKSNATVLITGENGTGKELVAREIHDHSTRYKQPFVAINCAAIPENLVESELFGHEKGAFTGAVVQKRGKFEIASGGTLFLDEIGDLSLSAQAKILRTIEEMDIERVGGERSITVDVRIIAATNRNLQEMVNAQSFREDLYYRLHVVSIHVPPLRKRVEDIEIIALHYLRLYGGKNRKFSKEALKCLKKYMWPGNIRQLKNIIQRIAILSEDEIVQENAIENSLQNEISLTTVSKDLLNYQKLGLIEAKDLFEKNLILQKLEKVQYNISKAAQEFGIYPSNLHNKMRKYGIETKK